MLTTESVLALAPDDASAKAARGLVVPAKWPLLGTDESAVWGECQGSGSKPYQAQVDLAGPAFRCTCPSRKFPCKHGLALLLLRVQDAGRFAGGPPPGWVAEWLASRADKAQKKEERASARAAMPEAPGAADSAAAARREAQRWQRAEAAAADLQRWLADQLAQGLGGLVRTALGPWETMAARLVDAQAPGLAQRLREAAAGVGQGEDWAAATLQRLGRLQLACDGLQRRAALAPAVQADLRTLVGWPLDKADVLAQGEAVADRWTVLGIALEERDARLSERRVWLQGQASGRRALLLDHAFAGRGFESAWLAGVAVDVTLVFYPSAAPLRALCDPVPAAVHAAAWPDDGVAAEWDRIADRIAAHPWVPLHPLVWPAATVLHDGGAWRAVSAGRALPLQVSDDEGWALLARSGGHGLHLAGEWNGERFAPLTAWRDGSAPPLWQRSPA